MMAIRFMGKARILFACMLLAAGFASGQEKEAIKIKAGTEIPAYARGPIITSRTNPIADLVLIYEAGAGRQPWTMDGFRPYVYREVEGKFEWLFDGFLFIDFLAPSGARLCPITQRKDATKRDWQELMEHYFQDGQNIAALDQLLGSLAAKGHKPIRKRQVVITLPTPMTGSDPNRIAITSEWGELDGKPLDFNRTEERLRAARWYVDEVLKRWQAKHYQHLELAGFYWVFERAWQVHHTQEIGEYIRSKGSHLYWIPSWPQGRKNWQQYGFDFVYQQPNYFFHRQPTPTDRLEAACQFAAGCGTSMEMEFNQDLLAKPAFLTYFDEYLRAYEKHRVWETRPVAYYEGHGAWSDMAKSREPSVQSRYQALADIIVKRQKKADAGFVFRQEANAMDN
jgi:hypothetical protein